MHNVEPWHRSGKVRLTPNQLDAREQRFVEEYLLDLDPKRSAIAAGYAKTTASTKSFGWVSKSKSTKPHVVAAIREALAERSERLKIEADWVLQRLIAEAEADLAAIYAEDGTLKPIDEWPVIWRKGLVTGLDVDQLREGGEQIGTVTSSFTRGGLSSVIPSPGAGKKHVKGFQLDLTATYGNSGGPVFSLESGKVFGVLQGGVVSQQGELVPGFTKAESVYPLMEDCIMKDILTLTEEEMKRRMGS